jgi:hypothetical protein
VRWLPALRAPRVAVYGFLSLVGSWACSKSSVPTPDGGDAGDGGPGLCTGEKVCAKLELRACRGGQVAELISDCSGIGGCSMGRCTSSECAAEESLGTSGAGCLFYSAIVDNVAADNFLGVSLLVTNPGPRAANVEFQRLAPNGTVWTTFVPATVMPGSSARVTIRGATVTEVGPNPATGYRLVSDGPVTVAQIQSDDLNQSSTSTSGTFILPMHMLGVAYRPMTYPQREQPLIAATEGSRGGAGRVVVVGLVSPTTVTFIPASGALVGSDSAPLLKGERFSFMLNDGDAFQIYSAAEGDDLTGSEITADGPIAVFSGNISTSYGRAAEGINSPDSAHEQMMPVAAWSTRFVAPALGPQATTCDPLLSLQGEAEASIWRIVASRDGTQVRFEPGDGTVGVPSNVELMAGQVWEGIVSGGSFAVSATFPIYVTQGIDCEPSLSPAIGTERLLRDLHFAVLPNFDQALAVVRPRGKAVSLDGTPLHDALFTEAGGGFQIAHLPISACSSASQICTHRLTGEFGMTLRGMDVLCSYAMTAPVIPACPPLAAHCVP